MAVEISLSFEQTDTGETLIISNLTDWAAQNLPGGIDIADIITVTLTVGYKEYEDTVIVFDYTASPPATNDDLLIELTKADFDGVDSEIPFGTDDVFLDGVWRFNYAVTVDDGIPETYAQDFNVLLDFNVRYAVYQFMVDLPYRFPATESPAYNEDIQKAQLYDSYLVALYYLAISGQIQKIEETLETLENLLTE
jgi:hypothetical protein